MRRFAPVLLALLAALPLACQPDAKKAMMSIQALEQTAAAILAHECSSSLSAAAAAELWRDANRTRDTNAGANLGVLRRVAASLLKQDRSRGSIKAKRFNAALDDKYLKQVLQGFKAH